MAKLFWSDQLAQDIVASGQHQPYWVDDMKTPSGRIHVGSLRGVIIHELLQRSLKDLGHPATYSYIFNDMDPMDGFPNYLPESFKPYMGKPLFQIPSPDPGYDSLAQRYAQEFIDVFNSLGVYPEILWSSQMYQTGKFNAVIKEVLDNTAAVRQLYREVSGYDKPQDWYPFQVICPQCGKVGTTLVTDWDGELVTFTCQPDLVTWAQGCGYHGKTSPFNGTGKFMWKVDWAAHWKVVGITIEAAGKDHMSQGGSHDLSSSISQQVLNYPPPYAFLYEWFLARGGSKMSSSKGVGVSAKEISQMLPPEVLRFLLVRTHYQKAIVFDPGENESILDLFDEFDRCAGSYFKEGASNMFGRAWELSQIGTTPPELPYFPRFRDVVNYVQQPTVDLKNKFQELKGAPLTPTEEKILEERRRYGEIWLAHYAPKEKQHAINSDAELPSLSPQQTQYLIRVNRLLNQSWDDAEALQQTLYQATKDLDLPAKEGFQALYLTLTGKTHGPKAAWFLLENLAAAKDRLSQLEKPVA